MGHTSSAASGLYRQTFVRLARPFCVLRCVAWCLWELVSARKLRLAFDDGHGRCIWPKTILNYAVCIALAFWIDDRMCRLQRPKTVLRSLTIHLRTTMTRDHQVIRIHFSPSYRLHSTKHDSLFAAAAATSANLLLFWCDHQLRPHNLVELLTA
jgi:hypothetical protein